MKLGEITKDEEKEKFFLIKSGWPFSLRGKICSLHDVIYESQKEQLVFVLGEEQEVRGSSLCFSIKKSSQIFLFMNF